MRIKLIGLDIDGTLLNSRKQLTARTRRAIEAAVRAGIRFTYVTGRPLSGIMEDFHLPAIGFAITSNGAVTHDLQAGKRLRSRCIPKDAAKVITALSLDASLNCTVFTGGLGYSDRRHYDALMEEYRRSGNLPYGQASRRPSDDLIAHIERDTEGVENLCIDTNVLPAHERMMAQMRQWPSLRVVTTRGARGMNMEIGHPDADKGLAFLDLAHALGIERGETLAIGDDGNDLGLLGAAGVGVAMGNAVDAVKAACASVTLDNDHDGVAIVIEDLLSQSDNA